MTDEKKNREVGKPRRLRGLIAGALLGLWLLAVIAIGCGVLSILYGWQPDRLRAGIEREIGDLLDREIRIGRLEGGLLAGLTLHDVSIAQRAPDARSSELLVARRISLRVDACGSLRERALVLADVSLVQPIVTLSRADEQALRLAGWGDLGRAGTDRPSAGLPFGIVLANARASDVHLSIRHASESGLVDVFGRLDLGVENLRFGVQSGIGWPEKADVQFDLSHARYGVRELGEGRLVAHTRGPRVEIEAFEVSGPLGGVALRGGLDMDERLDEPKVQSGQLAATLREVDLAAWFADAGSEADAHPPIVGPISGTIELGIVRGGDRGASDHRFDLRAVLEPMRVFGGEIAQIDAKASLTLEERRWSLEDTSVDLAAGRILVSGRGAGPVAEQFDVRARDLDLARLPRAWLPPARLQGRTDLDLSLHGRFDDPIGMLELDARNLRVDDVGPATLDLALRARGERRFVLDALDWKFERDSGRIAGTRIRSIGAPEFEIGPGAVTVRELAIDWTGGSMQIDGGFADGTLQPSRIELDSLDLRVLGRLLGIAGEPEGIVSGRLDVSGRTGDPEIAAQLRWASPRYRGVAADRIEIAIGTTPTRRRVEAVLTAGDVEPLRAIVNTPRTFRIGDPGRWLSDPRFELDLQLIDLDLVWLAPLLALYDVEPGGRLDGRLAVSGSSAGPIAVGKLQLAGARLDALPRNEAEVAPRPLFGPVTGVIHFEGNQLQTEALHYGSGVDELLLDATLGWSGRRAEDLDLAATLIGVGFHGRASLNAGIRGDVLETSVLSFSEFDVAELARGAGFTGQLGGRLDGEFVAHGPITEPDFKTHLAWHEPVVAGVRAERLFVDARREGWELSLEGGLERGGRRVLDVKGSLPLERGAGVGAWLARSRGWAGDPATRFEFVAMQFPLDWLPILAPRLPLRSDGSVDGTITLRGADSVPWIEGTLSIEQGTFSLATQTATIGPLTGRIEFEGRSARFDPLLISASRGRVALAGSVRWSGLGIDDVSVQTDFDGYRFDQLGLLQTTLDGRLLASGPLQAMHLKGEIRLGEVRVSFPNQQNPVLKEIRVMGLPDNRTASIREGEAEVAGIEHGSTVDVAIVLPKGTWIRGIGLDAEVFGEMHATKAVGQDLHYAGQIQVSHGRYKLQGKRFDLDRGVAVFTGGASPIPDIDIEAHRRASREVTVYAHVRGPADAPILELTSEPPMDTAEIISYLFFGRSATVGNRESTLGLGESAASLAGSMLVDSVAPELRNTLRIDEISVTSGDDEQAPAVEIETQVTPDVYLRLVQSFGPTADEAVEIRWRFWKDLSLKSKVHRSGTSAIDLLWEFNYWGLERYGLDGLTPPPPPPFQAAGAEGSEPAGVGDAKATAVGDSEAAPRDCAPPLVCPVP